MLQIRLPAIPSVFALRVFTKLMKPIVSFLRLVGCHLIIYLDDLLTLHQDQVQYWMARNKQEAIGQPRRQSIISIIWN